MNKIYIFFFLLFLQISLRAQVAEKRICGTNEYMHELELNNPEIIAKRQLIEQHTHQYIEQANKRTRAVITIPVVVHVVYNLGSQNISDAQIQSQIAVLNKDFRRQNTDFGNTPGSFQPLAADCEIEFVLAKRDPNGDSTTGITRTYTATTAFSANNNIKNSATGGRSPWPAGEYLNIWVGKLSGGLLGYGQFPGGPAATDGVVISYRAFGTTGSALAPFNKGRTTTHEVGHWLNLFHIWGDDGGNCNGSDLVEDTPNQGAENYGVPAYPHISCNNTPFGDMFMNYMDYTDDVAMTMFSAGQKVRMDAMFSAGGFRYTLLSSQGGNYPVPQVACGVPSNISTSNVSVTNAQIDWDITPNAASYNIAYKKLADTTWNMLTASVNNMQLTNLTANTAYEYKIQSACPNGLSAFSVIGSFTTMPIPVVICTDNYESNNTLTSAITIARDSMTHSMINNPSDNDYYRVEIAELMHNVKITLSALPQDYDLYLYSARGALLKTSQAGGLKNEEIVHNPSATGPATYYIRVKGYNGAYSNTDCYALNIETSASAFKEGILSSSETKPEFVMYPVPASDFITTNVYYEGSKDLVCNIYNSFGQKIITQKVVTQKGVNELRFQTGSLATGLYLLEVIDSEERRVQQFNVNK